MRTIVLATLCLAVLAGCVGGTTPPSRYYLLAADPALTQGEKVKVPAGFSVAVGPVDVPSHLDRLQIVTKKNRHQLELAEFDLWAEPLDENLGRILVENLSRILETDQVLTFEQKRGTPVDFEIAVDVEKMDAVSNTRAELVARWTVIRSRGREHLFTRRSRLQTPIEDTRFETLAEAMSRNASELSMEIATAIGQLAP